MRVGVTGAAGFIGRHLVHELGLNEHEVVACDRELPTGPPRVHTHFEHFDLLERDAFRNWVGDYNLDTVVHLAAQVGRAFGEDDLSRTVRWNAEVTTLVAAACGELSVRLAYTSTSEIYGDHGDEPCHEFVPWKLPYNLYGLTKRWGEEVAQLYAPRGLTILRLSMPYGPGSPPGRGRRAMDTMLWQAHHRMPLTVHRGAERSWCWVGDTVRGIRLALEESDGGIFNVGRDDDSRSMLEVARLACALADVPLSEAHKLITLVDPPANQVVVKRLPTNRLRVLGWQPTLRLEHGMPKVYEWVRLYDRDGNFQPTANAGYVMYVEYSE